MRNSKKALAAASVFMSMGTASCGGGSGSGGIDGFVGGAPSAPVTTLTAKPSAVSAGSTATFQFTASVAGSTFECNLDSAGYLPCTSPYVVTQSSGTSATHTLLVQATSPAAIVEATPASYGWAQQNFNAVALYHFDSATGATTDSCLFTGSFNNSLSDLATTSTPAGKFSEAQVFTATNPSSMSAADSTTLALVNDQMTLDTFVKFSTLPASGSYMVIAGKMGSAGNYGWDFGIVKWGPSYYLYFLGSLDGTSAPTDLESNSISIATGAWHHVAATWDKATGSVTFYYDGTQVGSSPIGATGTPLFHSSRPFRLGASELSSGASYGSGGILKNLDGSLDEFRLSQIVRWNASFAVPASAPAAD